MLIFLPLTHVVNKCLGAVLVPGAVLGTWNYSSKQRKIPAFAEVIFYQRRKMLLD